MSDSLFLLFRLLSASTTIDRRLTRRLFLFYILVGVIPTSKPGAASTLNTREPVTWFLLIVPCLVTVSDLLRMFGRRPDSTTLSLNTLLSGYVISFL